MRVSSGMTDSTPSIQELFVRATRTSLSVQAVLSNKGGIYCANFEGIARPFSVLEIISRKIVGWSGTDYFDVNVTMFGSLPDTLYTVYCVPVSSTGSQNTSLTQLLFEGKSLRTLCCRQLAVSVTSSFVQQGVSASAIATVTMDPIIISGDDLSLYLRATFLNQPYNVLVPSALNISRSSPLTFPVAFDGAVRSPVGDFELDVVITRRGSPVTNYEVVYPHGKMLRVLGVEDVPLAPSLQYAQFDNNGVSVTVAFDMATDRGRTIGRRKFPCWSTLAFRNAGHLVCQWSTDATKLIIWMDAAYPLNSYDTITLVPAVLRASCLLTNLTKCLRWPSSNASSVQILPPVNPANPVVYLTVPVAVGACDGITIDFSGSTGSGGRSWLSVNISVISSAPNITEITDTLRLYEATRTKDAVFLHRETLSTNSSYLFTVTLCSFLGACGQASSTVKVVDATIPYIKISGGGQVRRNYSVELSALASVSACDGSSRTTNLDYRWYIDPVGGTSSPVNALVSISKDPSKYILRPFQLLPLHSYVVIVIVTDHIGGGSANARASLFVVQSNLIVRLSGGTEQSLRQFSSVVIDASYSFDSDQADNQRVGIFFLWNCYESLPMFNMQCPLRISVRQDNASISAFASEYSLNSTSVVGVSLVDSTRAASGTRTVSIIPQLSPVVTILTSSGGKFSQHDILVLQGNVNTTVPCKCTWTLDDPTVDLSIASLVDPTTEVLSGFRNLYLRISAITFRAGVELSFQLKCSSLDGHAAYSSLTVEVNSPPSPGSCHCSPLDGTALSTVFTLYSQNWVDLDGDLPLWYQFGFFSAVMKDNLVVQPKSQQSTATSRFAEGPASMNGTVALIFEIFDNLGSQSTGTLPIKVSRGANTSSAFLKQLTVSLLKTAEGNVNLLKQTISIISETVNAANCSHSPICALLNRGPCLETSNTCGECISSQFVGTSGNSNDLCVPVASASTIQELTKQKSCTSNCSGHGDCVFLDSDTFEIVHTCTLYSPACVTSCYCIAGYFGQDCSLDENTLLSHQSTITSLQQALLQVTNLEIASTASVTSSVNSLLSLTVNPALLTAVFLEVGTNMTLSLLEQIATTNQDPFPAAKVLDNFGSAAVSMAGVFRRRKLSNAALTSAWQASLDALGSSAAQQMVPGEGSRISIQRNFRLMAVAPAEPGNLSITAPQTVLELLHGEHQTSARIDTSSDTKLNFMTMPKYILELTGFPVANQQNITSNAIRISSDSTSAGDTWDNCTGSPRLEFTFIHYESVAFGSRAENESVVSFCKVGHPLTAHVNCSGNISIPISCNGTSTYNIRTQCPQRTLTATCLAGERLCATINHSSTTTTCRCDPCTTTVLSSQRRLDGKVVAAGVTVVSLAEYSLTEYANVMYSAADFNSVSALRSTALISLTFGTLWFGTILSVVLLSLWKPFSRAQRASKQQRTISPGRSVQNPALEKCVQEYISELFGHAFSDEPPSERLLRELTNKHEYLSIFAMEIGYDQWINVFSLLTNLTASFFLLVVFFDIQFPNDDGSCVSLLSEEVCLTKKSMFNPAELRCAWNSVEHSCLWKAPSFDLNSVLAVSIIVLLVTAPISLALTYICDTILLAPSLHKLREAKEVIQARRSSVADILKVPSSDNLPVGLDAPNGAKPARYKRESSLFGNVNEMDTTLHRATVRAHRLLAVVTKKQHRGQATLPQKRYKDFAGFSEDLNSHYAESWFSETIWKEWHPFLDHDHRGIAINLARDDRSNHHERARVAASTELDMVVKEADSWASKLTASHPEHIGAQILELFVRDCLGQHSRESIIFSNKVNLFTEKYVLTSGIKCVAFSFLLLMDLYFIFACMLYGRDKGHKWQIGWFYACMVNLAVDVFINSVTMAAVIHYLVPNLIVDKARQLRGTLSAISRDVFRRSHVDISDLGTGAAGAHVDLPISSASSSSTLGGNINNCGFSPSAYYFVSVHLARMYPDLLESQLVLSYPRYSRSLSLEQTRKINPDFLLRSYSDGNGDDGSSFSVAGGYGWAATLWRWMTTAILVFGSQSLLVQQMLISLLNPALVSLVAYFGMAIIHSSLGVLAVIAMGIVVVTVVYWIVHSTLGHQRGDLSTSVVAPLNDEEGPPPQSNCHKVVPFTAKMLMSPVQFSEQADRYSKLPLMIGGENDGDSLGSYASDEDSDMGGASTVKDSESSHSDISIIDIGDISEDDSDDISEEGSICGSDLTEDVIIDEIIDEDGVWSAEYAF
jgi:hypothetical protein